MKHDSIPNTFGRMCSLITSPKPRPLVLSAPLEQSDLAFQPKAYSAEEIEQEIREMKTSTLFKRAQIGHGIPVLVFREAWHRYEEICRNYPELDQASKPIGDFWANYANPMTPWVGISEADLTARGIS